MEKIVKKLAKRVAFSFYGILEIFVLLLPLVVIGLGIYFLINDKGNGILWIIVGALCLILSIRKFKDIFEIYKFVFNPKKYPVLVHLKEDGLDLEAFKNEILDSNLLDKMNKNNPIIMTENFIIGCSQVNFFIMYIPYILWTYEYNGNGIVFYDKNRFYGYTYFQTVDGNDKLMEELKDELPYIYFGTDFDYKKIMHDELDQTIEFIQNEREEFLKDKTAYRIKKAEEERIKAEEETKRLEEEKLKAESETVESEEKLDNTETTEETDSSKEENKDEE